MKELFQGTAPTISFQTDLRPADVDVLHMIFCQKGKVLFRKEADSVTWGENFLAVTLTQEESYKLNEGLTSVRVRFKAQNGLVSFTDPYYFTVVKDEEGVVIL